jgi:hypothetical protein
MRKVACQFCEKKFHPKGLPSHRAHCRVVTAKTVAPVDLGKNFASNVASNEVHPRTELMHGAARLWDTLSDHEKLFAIALFMERSRGY